jgi:hypothetical protein
MTVKLENRNPLTTADVLITIEGLPGYWSGFSGGGFDVSRPMYSDGISNQKRPAGSGTVEYQDVTLTKSFDPDVDQPTVEFFERFKTEIETFDLTLRPVKRANGVEQRGTKARYLTGCRVKTFRYMDNMDTGKGDEVANITVTLAVESDVWK